MVASALLRNSLSIEKWLAANYTQMVSCREILCSEKMFRTITLLRSVFDHSLFL